MQEKRVVSAFHSYPPPSFTVPLCNPGPGQNNAAKQLQLLQITVLVLALPPNPLSAPQYS